MKIPVIHAFEELCREKGVKFSVATIALYEAALSQVPRPAQKKAGVRQVALESFTLHRTKIRGEKDRLWKVKN